MNYTAILYEIYWLPIDTCIRFMIAVNVWERDNLKNQAKLESDELVSLLRSCTLALRLIFLLTLTLRSFCRVFKWFFSCPQHGTHFRFF